jgi:hypothetical protein
MFDNEACAYVKVSSLKITSRLQYLHGTWLSLSSASSRFSGAPCLLVFISEL